MKRYELEERPYSHGDLGMIARPRGPWVRYSDAAAALGAAAHEISTARDRAMRPVHVADLAGALNDQLVELTRALERIAADLAALAEEKPDAE